MKSLDFLNEDIVTDAHDMKMDHEVQLARKDCYAAAENAIALHKMLRHISEQQGLEGWVAAKITLANDYLNTVREYMEYNLLSMGNAPAEVVVQTPEMPIAENAGSVATVVNPAPKDKAKTGTLFGGTYKQKKAK